jgi:glycosyltransferase involved in cell wall biosynthesis
MTPPISAYMLTCNNADTVRTALASLGFVDEIVVVDSGSTDGTLEIVREYTDRIIERPWPGFREQYRFAGDQCTHDWALFIDADEEVSEPLAQEIVETLAANVARPEAEQVQGYHGHRRTFYLDRWILHGGWLPDYEVRLYRRSAGRWAGDLHAKIAVDGAVADFRHFYYHYTYRDIGDQLKTIDKYSATAAEDMERNGRAFSLLRLLFSPPARFVKDYFLKLGFLDGFPGLVVAVNTSFYVFTKHARLWERQRITPEVAARGRARRPE